MFNELVFVEGNPDKGHPYLGGSPFLPASIAWPADSSGSDLLHLASFPSTFINQHIPGMELDDKLVVSVFTPYSLSSDGYIEKAMNEGGKVLAYIPTNQPLVGAHSIGKKMSKVINEFLSRYEKEFDFYQNLATNIEVKIKNELSKHGVRTIVSSRAKSTSRLDVKLEDRNSKKNYKSVVEIYDDIVDLAGVRVALYFPGDIKVVEDVINKNLKVHKVKRFPDVNGKKKIGEYQKVFDGYSAVHFRVSLNDEGRYGNNHCVEIQVASVLMHAWSEVEHDLIYKPLQGDLSHEELMILDEINGLVLSGNIALERLQKAGQLRVTNENSGLLLNHYDLASYLLTRTSEFNEDALDFRLLFSILKLMDLNNKNEVNKILDSMYLEKPTKKKQWQLIDIYAKSIAEANHEKVITVFNSKKFHKDEVSDLFRNMVWMVIEKLDGSGAVKAIRPYLSTIYFDLEFGGRNYFDNQYVNLLNVNEYSDEELSDILREISNFYDDIREGHINKDNISVFISACKSILLPDNA
ncbi:RelA/SpoT domain-containing protein [Pectobacterium brasiliense]|uniref:GTP pyrophosphokinase n=1 Tax=Pectobacterium brasiliense TaxID=180957 RepID=UPI0019698D23|nr:RelA/SpoT domain-containing protein [Pectobacterium brasiliense]MBN3199312.1 RelA/SpoT domain-containing protein [Pectobacterium brasiliense]